MIKVNFFRPARGKANKSRFARWPGLLVAGTILCSVAGAIVGPARAQTVIDEEQFLADLEFFTSFPHRLPGSQAGTQTVEYLEQRLAAAGVREVYRYHMEVPYLDVERCEMVIADQSVPLSPMRPNLTIPPATPKEGVSGPLLYVGGGELKEYGRHSPEGAIVFLNYDSFDNWRRAFTLGAKAVVFIGEGDETPSLPLHTGLPVNLLRFYVDRSDLPGLDLAELSGQEVELHSQVRWDYRWEVNLVARVTGTNPMAVGDGQGPESMVLSASYDTFGEVPHRSPGARRAANLAALLGVAEYFGRQPAERNMIFMFLGGRSYNHQGAREIYDALLMPRDQHQQLIDHHREEMQTIRQAFSLLEEQGLLFDRDAEGARVLRTILRDQAQFARDDVSLQLQLLRLHYHGERDDEFRQREQYKERLNLQWDVVRRAIHERRLDELIEQRRQYAQGVFETAESTMWGERQRQEARQEAAEMEVHFEQLVETTRERVGMRLQELEALRRNDLERTMLRSGLFGLAEALALTFERTADFMRERLALSIPALEDVRRADLERVMLQQGIFDLVDSAAVIQRQRGVVLHVSFDFSDLGPQWGVVAGHHLHRLLGRGLAGDGDSPGYYVRVLAAFRQAAETLGNIPDLSTRALRDPLYGSVFVPGMILPEGLVAGSYGVYNVALSTGFDRRGRDGHPADTLERLDGGRILAQSQAAARLLREVANRSEISLPRIISPQAISKYPSWRGGRAWGDMATKQIVGGLAETRPAANALMALWPGGAGMGSAAWENLAEAGAAADFSPFTLERVDANGRFRVIGARRDLNQNYMKMGVIFDDAGQVEFMTSMDGIRESLTATSRASLFPSNYGVIAHQPIHRAMAGSLRMVKGSTNAAFRQQEALWGTLDHFSFGYISAKNVGDTIKFFQPLGPVVLGEFTPQRRSGMGLFPAELRFPPRTSRYSHRDLWQLNEDRLRTMRSRGVTRADLEILHNIALASTMQADYAETVAETESLMQSSTSLSHRLYGPLLSSLDDLVHAIVILLLLTIPFAFAMERLAICATSIYGRIVGFVVMFGITFGLLYWMHPGFAISATPMIIFLAFAILLLSSLVIYLLLRKFDTELKTLQGQSVGLHDVEVSRTGTMLAAVSMGMSTMRRRPTRTILTAVTVVILTFTILSFASFTRNVGVRTVYEGPIGENMPISVLAHRIDFAALPVGVPDLLRRHADNDGLLAAQWWRVRKEEQDASMAAANPRTGDTVDIEAALGIDPEELRHWPALAECLIHPNDNGLESKQSALREGEVFLPEIVAELLHLSVGDTFLLHGREVALAGTLHGANLQRLRHIDNRPVVPVDFREIGPDAMQEDEDDDTSGGLVQAEVDRNFTRLSGEQIFIGSDELVRKMGGNVHIINLYPGAEVDISEKGRELAQLLSTPVWAAGPNGVERMILTLLTEVAGGMALAVPLLLGGFIIFGTLLGSITDREKEIYTFSALGLSPGHVGMLFFAEAAVYAVVGGMGGQLLAQFTALIASVLAERGMIQPVSINFSSTNSLFAIGVVMLVVLISAIYPAICASKSANPGLARSWRMPAPEGDQLNMTFPFTVSAYDITGVVSFLAEHFRSHDDAGLGNFAASQVAIKRNQRGYLELSARLALAPFDLGVTQDFVITAVPSEIEGVDEVVIRIHRLSGAQGDWIRGNRVFIRDLRIQFLAWRTLSGEAVEDYRIKTLKSLGEKASEPSTAPGSTPIPAPA